MVVGIGLNVNQTMFQGTFNLPPTSLKIELNENVDRERLLAEILNNFEELLSLVQNNPEALMKEWKSKCRMIGERIEVSDDKGKKYGIFDDLDENGFLLLKIKDKIEKIHYGDVSIQ